MKAFWSAAVAAALFALPAAAAPGTAMRGYSTVGAAGERAVESRFIDIPSAADQLDFVRQIAARPHWAGSSGDYALAVYVRDRMRAFGIRAELRPFSLDVATPRELVLELAPPGDLATAGTRKHARFGSHADFPIGIDLTERGDSIDPGSDMPGAGLPFNPGSGEGSVSAPLVYANHGMDADYRTLEAADVDVRGAILLVRYGAEFRGELAQRAQARGAAGLIFYSDPQDDGDARGLVAPDGPWRPRTAVERGWIGTGIHIPVLPVSAANAQILLGALSGAPGPAGWAGALAADYPVGRGPGRVHLAVTFNHRVMTLWNTIGTIAGIHGDQSVVVGAHRDAWGPGATANGSGVATLLGVAQGLGYLLHSGWRPQRTIVLAGWDGGELGSAGSRAYVYDHRFEIPAGCVAYLDADETVTGKDFAAGGTAALAPLIAAAAHAVSDSAAPAATLLSSWIAKSGGSVPIVAPPGAERDDASFLEITGTPVAGMQLRGPFGVAGSSFDSLHYATTISDPDFGLHRTAAQVYGVLTLRLADAPGAPYEFGAYPSLLRGSFAQLTRQARAAGLVVHAPIVNLALERLTGAATAFRAAEPDPAGWPDALLAVRTLDGLLYGATGETSIALPDIAGAIRTRDQAGLDTALIRTAASLTRAAGYLGRAVGDRL